MRRSPAHGDACAEMSEAQEQVTGNTGAATSGSEPERSARACIWRTLHAPDPESLCLVLSNREHGRREERVGDALELVCAGVDLQAGGAEDRNTSQRCYKDPEFVRRKCSTASESHEKERVSHRAGAISVENDVECNCARW